MRHYEMQACALGTSRDLYAEGGRELQSGRFAVRAYITTDLLAIVTHRLGGDAVGFVSFGLKWIADGCTGMGEVDELEVELDQVWMAPAFRRRGWGELAVTSSACATRRSVDQVEATTHWPAGFVAPLKIKVCADLYSASARRCWPRVLTTLRLDLGSGRS